MPVHDVAAIVPAFVGASFVVFVDPRRLAQSVRVVVCQRRFMTITDLLALADVQPPVGYEVCLTQRLMPRATLPLIIVQL